jgi:plastocyanin
MRQTSRLVSIVAAIGFAAFTANGTDHVVNIYWNGYSPSYLQIAPGDSVYWVNRDDFPHTVTSLDGLWQTGYLLDYEDVWGLTFIGQGIYNYVCSFDGFTGTIVVQAAAVPANDLCSGAVTMTPGTVYTMDTSGATSTADPTLACGSPFGRTVWYQYTSSASGSVTLSTCGSQFDTVLAVYAGSCASLGAAVACNDDNGPSCAGIAASVTFSAIAGTTYRVAVGGFQSDSGSLRMVLTAPPSGPSWNEVVAPFGARLSLGRPSTNQVHMVDSTNDRLLTLDTETGTFVSSIRLLGKPQGLMALSVDQQFLSLLSR